MSSRVYLSPPDIGDLEESYVVGALRSGWVAPTGPELTRFEKEVAERVGVAEAVAVSSGTAGIHLSLLALGVGPGDIVLVPTLTFVATANAVVYTGAEPFFVDCLETDGNIDVELTADLIQKLNRRGERVTAILPVDLLGECADYEALMPLSQQHDISLVEDSAEALGANFQDSQAGSFGNIAVLSFNGNKIITTSGGGMVLSHNKGLIDRVRYLSTQARQPVRHYEHTDIGYNYRLSNLLAALGRAQLSRVDTMISKRRDLREYYRKLFATESGVRILGKDDPGANCWLTAIIVDSEESGWNAAQLGKYLEEFDIETRPLWKPMHLQPVFADARSEITGTSEKLFDNGIVLPSGSGMTESQRDRVFSTIESFLERR